MNNSNVKPVKLFIGIIVVVAGIFIASVPDLTPFLEVIGFIISTFGGVTFITGSGRVIKIEKKDD